MYKMWNYKFKKSKRIYEAMIDDKPRFIIDSANTFEEDWFEDKLRIFQHNGKRWKLVEITCCMDDWEDWSVVSYYDSENCNNYCYYDEKWDDIYGLRSHSQMVEFEETVISCFADRSNSCCVNGVDIRTLKKVNSLEDFLKLIGMDKELGIQYE